MTTIKMNETTTAATGNQRWREGRTTFVPPSSVFDPTGFSVAPIEELEAKAFVLRHHYSASYPAARFRFGLLDPAGELVGVAVFSSPSRKETVMNPFPSLRSHLEAVDLGRFVLLDELAFNAETWFLSRAFDSLSTLSFDALSERQQKTWPDELEWTGIRAVVSFSDPMPRTTSDGEIVLPGHVGTIYQARSATYLGRANAGLLRLLPDGSLLHTEARSKIRKRKTGWRAAVANLVERGAPEPGDEDELAEWLERAVETMVRRVRHPGNHKYGWVLPGRGRTAKRLARTLRRELRPATDADGTPLPYPRRNANGEAVSELEAMPFATTTNGDEVTCKACRAEIGLDDEFSEEDQELEAEQVAAFEKSQERARKRAERKAEREANGEPPKTTAKREKFEIDVPTGGTPVFYLSRGNRFDATIHPDGSIVSKGGRSFPSPSAAARDLTGSEVNGWKRWRVEKDGLVFPIDVLRGRDAEPFGSKRRAKADSTKKIAAAEENVSKRRARVARLETQVAELQGKLETARTRLIEAERELATWKGEDSRRVELEAERRDQVAVEAKAAGAAKAAARKASRRRREAEPTVDEDGIDGPFDRAMEKAMEEDRRMFRKANALDRGRARSEFNAGASAAAKEIRDDAWGLETARLYLVNAGEPTSDFDRGFDRTVREFIARLEKAAPDPEPVALELEKSVGAEERTWKNLVSRDPRKAAAVRAISCAAIDSAGSHHISRVTCVEIDSTGTRVRGHVLVRAPELGKRRTKSIGTFEADLADGDSFAREIRKWTRVVASADPRWDEAREALKKKAGVGATRVVSLRVSKDGTMVDGQVLDANLASMGVFQVEFPRKDRTR